MWLWSEQIDEMFIQSPGQKPNVRKFSSICLEVKGFFNTLVWQLCLSPYTFLTKQSHFHHLSEKCFEQRKEMTFDCALANIRAAGFIPFSQNLIKSYA